MKKTRAIEAVLRDSAPTVWACECGLMNLRDDYYCRTCGGDREENWEGNDREAVLREEQWDSN
jgi:hypothetical protein